MKNLKTQLISLMTLASLVGAPAVGFAQTAPASTSRDAAKAAVEMALQNLKVAREAFRQAIKDESDARSAEDKENRENKARSEDARKSGEAKRMEAEKRKMNQRKEVLVRLIEVQIKHLNNVWRRVEKMPNISDAKKAELKTEIDKTIVGLNELKAKVKAATTEEQLKDLGKQLRDYIKSKNDLVKKIVDAISADALRDLAARADERIAAAEAKIAELKAAGKNVTELEALLATAKAKLDAAKAAMTREAWSEVKEALKDVYEALRELAKEAEDDSE